MPTNKLSLMKRVSRFVGTEIFPVTKDGETVAGTAQALADFVAPIAAQLAPVSQVAQDAATASEQSHQASAAAADLSQGSATPSELSRQASGLASGLADASRVAAAGSALNAAASAQAAAAVGKVFATVALGIAGTANGQSFSVLSADGQSLVVYLNNAGTAAELARYYTKGYFDAMLDKSISLTGSGYAYAIVGALNRVVFGIRKDGQLVGKFPKATIGVANGLSVSYDQNGNAVIGLGTQQGILPVGSAQLDQSKAGSNYTGGYVWAVAGSSNRIGVGLKADGTLIAKYGISVGVANGLSFVRGADGTYRLALGTIEGKLPLGGHYMDTTQPGAYGAYLWAIVDANGRIALGIKRDGTVTGKFNVTVPPSIPLVYQAQQIDGAAYGVFAKQVGNLTQLFAVKKSSGAITQLTSTGNNVNPVWSGDQANVLFASDRNGSPEQLYVPITGGAKNRVIPYADLIGWGDSMTAPGSGYFDTLLAQPAMAGRVGTNQGIGGQVSAQISQRAGGLALTGSVTGGQIPANGSVALTGLNFIQNTNYSVDAVIAGVPGTITEHYTVANSDNTYTFTVSPSYTGPAVPVANPVTITPTSTFYPAGSSGVPFTTTRNRIHSIRIGANDIGKVGYSQATTLANIAAVVDRISSYYKWFFVMGVSSAYGNQAVAQGGLRADEATAQLFNDQIIALN